MTPLIAATLLTITAVAAYGVACWVIPFGTCRRCKGTGHRPGRIARSRLRPCRRCRASGRRLRYGRRAYNYLAKVHRERSGGTRPTAELARLRDQITKGGM
ncbi:MAG: hypothetical protein ACRD0P_16770 [Stackebrandtia sp.]